MKLKIFVILAGTLLACVIHAADKVIILRAKNTQTELEPKSLTKSEASLLHFEKEYPVELPEHLDLLDLQSYQALPFRATYQKRIEQIINQFKKQYLDPSEYEQIFEMADNLKLSSVKQVIAQILLSPELNLEELEKHTYSNYSPALRNSLALQWERRIKLAKERFLWLSNPKIKKEFSPLDDPYFKGVSVQDFFDYHGSVRVQPSSQGTLSLKGKFLNSLKGLEKVLFIREHRGDPVHTLDLSDNLLTEIPNNIPGTQAIQKLLLARNKIKDFPDEFTGECFGWSEFMGWDSLKYLDLQNNNIRYIPSNIRGLDALETLQLSENKIIALPQNLKGLASLLYLFLSKNGIINIPSSITGLEKLHFLDLKSNNIADVPEDIQGLELLQRLSLVGNPVKESAQGKRKLDVLRESLISRKKPRKKDDL